MKKIVSIAVAMFAVVCVANAQTTWQDYNYITTGLKSDVSANQLGGCDYQTTTIGVETSIIQNGVERNGQLYSLKQGPIIKAFVLKTWTTKGRYSYFCLPVAGSDTDVKYKSFQAIRDAGTEWNTVFTWALTEALSQKL